MDTIISKRMWMTDWCKKNHLSPYIKENWNRAEEAYNEDHNH